MAKQQKEKQPEQMQPVQATDKTRPGGYYIVNGIAVDANGKPIEEEKQEEKQDEQPDSGSEGQTS